MREGGASVLVTRMKGVLFRPITARLVIALVTTVYGPASRGMFFGGGILNSGDATADFNLFLPALFHK